MGSAHQPWALPVHASQRPELLLADYGTRGVLLGRVRPATRAMPHSRHLQGAHDKPPLGFSRGVPQSRALGVFLELSIQNIYYPQIIHRLSTDYPQIIHMAAPSPP